MQSNIAKLILRLMIGGMMFLHGLAKLSHGIDFIKGMVIANGLPGLVAYGVYIGEVLAPLLIIIGFKSRLAAGVVAFNMIVAIYLVHLNDIFMLTNTGAWAVETQMLYLFGSICIVLLGSGKYAAKPD
ncbi:MAG: DoxX family protein [Sulfurovaceae bacterium]|nr:DoxX family protein [Sulfurovaceae bacterium]